MKISKKMKYLAAVPALAALVAGGFLAPAAQADDGVDSTTPPPETSLVVEGPVSIPPEVDATSVATDAVEVVADPVVVEAPIEDTATQQVDTVADPTQGAVTSEGTTEGTTPEVVAPGVVAPDAPVAEVLAEDPADLPVVAPNLSVASVGGYTVTFNLEGGSDWNDGGLYWHVIKDGEDEFYGAGNLKLSPGQTSVTVTTREIPGLYEFYVGVNRLAGGVNEGGDQSNFVNLTLPYEEPEEETRVRTETQLANTTVDCVSEPEEATDYFDQRSVKERLDAETGEWVFVEASDWKFAYEVTRAATEQEIVDAKCDVVVPPDGPGVETPGTPGTVDPPKAIVEPQEAVVETATLAATGVDIFGTLRNAFALLLLGGAILVIRRMREQRS